VPVLEHFQVEDQREADAGGQLNPHVPAGESDSAEPALAAPQQPADDRQVVRQAQPIEAGEAPRVRAEDAFFERQPADEHVQEAAGANPEEEYARHPDDFGEWEIHAARIASAACSGDRPATGTSTSALAR